MEITSLSYSDLQKLEKQVKDAIQQRYEQEKDDLKRQVRELVKQKAGVSVEELFGFGKSSSAAKRGKAAPKYRDPANAANTWTGRGRPPVWMQNQLNAGRQKDDFLI